MATNRLTSTLLDHPERGADPLASRLANAFRSPRLCYRAIETADADFFFHMRSDPEGWLNLNPGCPRPTTLDQVKEFIPSCRNNLLAVLVEIDPSKPQPDGIDSVRTPIGYVSLRHIGEADSAQNRAAEFGVQILPQYQSYGYGSEALRWILEWGFSMAGLHRVQLASASWNTKAIRAYESVGFKREGVQKEAVWRAGLWWDRVLYGILDREWEQVKKDREARGLRI